MFSLLSEDFYFTYFKFLFYLINQFCFLLCKLFSLSFFFYRTYVPQVSSLILLGVHVHCGLPGTLAGAVYVGTDRQKAQGLACIHLNAWGKSMN